jgi:hypothetical protein
MQIDFEPQEDASNLSKHGLSLALAGELNRDAALVWVDDRTDFGAPRKIANHKKFPFETHSGLSSLQLFYFQVFLDCANFFDFSRCPSAKSG